MEEGCPKDDCLRAGRRGFGRKNPCAHHPGRSQRDGCPNAVRRGPRKLGELLADLWTRFGETKAAIEATQTAPVDWNASLRAGKGTVLVGVVLLGIGI